MEPFLGQIILFAGNFAPRGWAFCDGQLLAISQNDALFSLLGTIYGGDGRTTFALPDFRGRTPIHFGAGPGLSDARQGNKGGAENAYLQTANLPPHNHVGAINTGGDVNLTSVAAGNLLATDARGGGTPPQMYSDGAPVNDMAAGSVELFSTGGSGEIPLNPPMTGINYIIALVGVYPSRN